MPGMIGIKGERGSSGLQGEEGRLGPAGKYGYPGDRGKTGPPGPHGATGEPGRQTVTLTCIIRHTSLVMSKIPLFLLCIILLIRFHW